VRGLWHRLLVRLGIRKPRVYHGAKARVYIKDADGSPRLIGVFENVTYGVTYDVDLPPGQEQPVPPPDSTYRKVSR
jgi:hypothetical protein